jgi:signal transduction histidine kinase
MPVKTLLANFPIIALVMAVSAISLFLGAQAGLAADTLALIVLVIVAAALGWLVFSLNRRLVLRDKHTRQLRFIAERFQAMIKTLPGGFCLFTPQGMLREDHGVADRLGLEKLAHFEDIVGAVRESGELIEAFRALQNGGTAFALQVKVIANNFDLQITGRRFRIGHDGPFIDILWFNDNPEVAQQLQQQSVSLSTIEQRAKQLQSIVNAISCPVWGRTRDLQIVMCNTAYAAALDAMPERVVQEQLELMSQTARGGSGRALAGHALAKAGRQSERRHVIIDGKRRLLDISEMPLPPASDVAKPEDIVLIGFAVDVTAEEDKDTELQRHLAAHREVMEHLGTAIAIYGADTRLEFYNRAYQRLWDADEAFLDSKPSFGEVLEDMRARRRGPEQADFQRYKKDRMGLFTSLLEPREDLMHLPDGTSLRILAVPHPFGGIMFVHEDVTDRLALESSYNTLIAVQRETLDNLAEGVAVFGPDGKLRLYNPAFAQIWKLSHDFLQNEPHIAELLEHMKPLFNYGANWASFKNEMVGYTLDRNSRRGRIERADHAVIEFLTAPLPDGAVLNSYLDVSDSVRVEQALRASNAALATADRLKSEFVANVSYQLRTPLNTITGFAEILTEQYFGALNDKQLEYARTIKEASESLSSLINDVLDLATIEAGRMTLERTPVIIADLLNDAKQMTAEWARQQSLQIMIDCPSDIGAFDVDAQRIRQVMYSLISNAIKYTPAGGRITLEARNGDTGWVNIAVQDTGIGIPDGDLDRVFGKFERANAQAKQGGAGLGLSLVKSFVELHGGRIEIVSTVNQGTRVIFSLPRKALSESDAVSPARQPVLA